MNTRTSRLLRRYATMFYPDDATAVRSAKRSWQAVIRRERHAVRLHMNTVVRHATARS